VSVLDQVVDLVKQNGVSVTFHVIDEVSYNRAKVEGYDLSDPHPRPVSNGVGAETRKAKLCYLVKSTGSLGFSLRSVTGEDQKMVMKSQPDQTFNSYISVKVKHWTRTAGHLSLVRMILTM